MSKKILRALAVAAVVAFLNGAVMAGAAEIPPGTDLAGPSENLATSNSSGLDNVSAIDQSGSENTAHVTQNGNENNSDVDQSNNGNTALVDQADDRNTSVVEQIASDNSVAIVNQSGGVFGGETNNSSTIIQLGDGNDAGVDQHGTDLTSEILQNTWNWADVFQSGTGHFSSINQDQNNKATVDQSGDSNTSIVFQVGDHDGDMNEADVTQSGAFNQSDVLQVGHGNVAVVNQSGFGAFVSDDDFWLNEVFIRQYGTNDYAEATQTGPVNGASAGNVINIQQEECCIGVGSGIFNSAIAFQDGANNETNIIQLATGTPVPPPSQ